MVYETRRKRSVYTLRKYFFSKQLFSVLFAALSSKVTLKARATTEYRNELFMLMDKNSSCLNIDHNQKTQSNKKLIDTLYYNSLKFLYPHLNTKSALVKPFFLGRLSRAIPISEIDLSTGGLSHHVLDLLGIYNFFYYIRKSYNVLVNSKKLKFRLSTKSVRRKIVKRLKLCIQFISKIRLKRDLSYNNSSILFLMKLLPQLIRTLKTYSSKEPSKLYYA